MPTYIAPDRSTYLRLLLVVPAVTLLGFTGCSATDGTARLNHTDSNVQVVARAYNSESRGFDRPWPFGPESTEQ
jgi:hypothetical protein